MCRITCVSFGTRCIGALHKLDFAYFDRLFANYLIIILPLGGDLIADQTIPESELLWSVVTVIYIIRWTKLMAQAQAKGNGFGGKGLCAADLTKDTITARVWQRH